MIGTEKGGRSRALTIGFVFAAFSLALGACVHGAAFALDDNAAPAQPAQVEARNVLTVHFFSKALNEDRAFNLILPLDYGTSTSRYPVLYLLHGYTGNNTDWSQQTNLSAYAARYRLIIVMPDGSNGWYVNSASDPKPRRRTSIMGREAGRLWLNTIFYLENPGRKLSK